MKTILVSLMMLLIIIIVLKLSGIKDTESSISEANWETEKLNRTSLVQPLEFDSTKKDGYGFKLESRNWYLLNKTILNGSYLYPVNVEEFNMTNNKCSYDTVNPRDLISSTLDPIQKQGLIGIVKVKVICVKQNHKLILTRPRSTGLPEAAIEKR